MPDTDLGVPGWTWDDLSQQWTWDAAQGNPNWIRSGPGGSYEYVDATSGYESGAYVASDGETGVANPDPSESDVNALSGYNDPNYGADVPDQGPSFAADAWAQFGAFTHGLFGGTPASKIQTESTALARRALGLPVAGGGRSGGGGASGEDGMSDLADVGGGYDAFANPATTGGVSRYGAIMRQVAANVGMRVRAGTILMLILRLGWQAAAAATGLSANDLLYLFIKKKSSRRGRLGPHLRTIERRVHQADGYRRRVAKLAGHIGARSYHRAPPPFRRRRYPAQRRRK